MLQKLCKQCYDMLSKLGVPPKAEIVKDRKDCARCIAVKAGIRLHKDGCRCGICEGAI